MKSIKWNLGLIEIKEVFPLKELNPRIRFGKFDYEIWPTQRALAIKPGRPSNMTTFFGGNLQDPLILDEAQVKKLPHDLVHACIWPVPETATSIGNMTPDICIPTGSGCYDVIELTTTQSLSLDSVSSAMREKFEKYQPFMQGIDPIIRRFNVIVVTPAAVYDSNGKLPDPITAQCLIEAYNYGRAIVRQFSQDPGFLSKETDELDSKRVVSQFESIRFDTDPSCPIDIKYINRPIDGSVFDPVISKESYKSSFKSFNSWEAKMLSRGPSLCLPPSSNRTIIHMPMLLVKEYNEEDIRQTSAIESWSNVYHTIFNNCLGKTLATPQVNSFDMLRMLSEAQAAPKKEISHSLPDVVLVRLNDYQELDLAMRGVMAVKNNLIDHPDIMSKRAKDKLDINYEEDLTHLEEYLKSDLSFSTDETYLDKLMEETKHTKQEEKLWDPDELLKEINKTSESRCLQFLDLVLREISYNSHRNPNDMKNLREFVFRMIPGFQAFVVCRFTKASGLDVSNLFFCIYFKGENYGGGVFENSYLMENGWRHTEFMSMDVQRLSHLQGVSLQYHAHVASLLDEVGSYDDSLSSGLSPFLKVRQSLIEIREASRVHMMILLENKQITSSTLQDWRYYYAELNSGLSNSLTESQKLTERFPEVIRSRLLLYFIRKTINIHKTLIEEKPHLNDPVGLQASDLNDDPDEEMESIDPDEASFRILKGIMTPFGFRIHSPSALVRAMYMGYLHNKDQGFSGHGVVSMMDKTLKQAYKFVDSFGKISNQGDKCGLDSIDPSDFKEYQHSRRAVLAASKLFRRRIMSVNGINSEKDYDKFILDYCTKFSLKTQLEDLATTKASTIPFNPDMQIHDANGEEIKEVGKRMKCIEAILANWSEFHSEILPLNTKELLQGIEKFEHSRLLVTLFRKAQIGGDREIYVLTLRGRMVIRIYSDLHRALCDLHPSEVLSKDESKDRFVSEHFEKRSKMEGQNKASFKFSADKTTWSQKFNLYSFMDMDLNTLPPLYHPFCQRVLNLHKRKTLQVPRTMIKSFLNNPSSTLSSQSVNRFKREVVGIDPLLLSNGVNGTSFDNSIDMMQGILHFPSSLYHVLACEYSEAMIKLWAKKRGVECEHSFEVSSDDEGSITSFACDDQAKLKRIMYEFTEFFPRLVDTVDKLFGIKTSHPKSTFSWQDFFEFNSKFGWGNSLYVPTIKFIENSLFDHPAESLSDRISQLYDKLRELRQNGCSGALCSTISRLQSMSFAANMGVSVMGWYRPGLWKEFNGNRTTCEGFYLSMNCFSAGLLDSTYVNWEAAQSSDLAKKIIAKLLTYNVPTSIESFMSSRFGVFPKRKYFEMLKRMGLQEFDPASITDEDFKMLLLGSRSLEESKKIVQLTACSPGIAKSLSQLLRYHVTRMAPYLMWTALYRVEVTPGNELKKSLKSLIEIIDNDGSEVPLIQSLFPMHDQFVMTKQQMTQICTVSSPKSFRRLKYQYIIPAYYIPEYAKHMTTCLRWHWYGVKGRLSATQMLSILRSLRISIPWLKEDPVRTLECSPFESYYELFGFLQSFERQSKPIHALVRGSNRKGINSIQVLMRNNAFSRVQVLTPETIVDVTGSPILDFDSVLLSQKCEDRMRAWEELAHNMKHETSHCANLLEHCREDVSLMSSLFSESVILQPQGSSFDRDTLIKQIAVIGGKTDLKTFVMSVDSAKIYKSVQEEETREGDYEYIQVYKRESISIKHSGSLTFTQSTLSESQVKTITGLTEITKHTLQPVIIPELKITDIRMEKGWLLCLFEDPLTKAQFWIDFPRCASRESKMSLGFNPNLPDYIDVWLSRVNLSNDEIQNYLDFNVREQSLSSAVKRSILRFIKTQSERVSVKRLAERMEVSEDEEYSDAIRMDTLDMFDALLDTMEGIEFKIEDWMDGVIDPGYLDWAQRSKTMEAHALESFISLSDTNRLLVKIHQILSFLSRFPRFTSTSIRSILDWYSSIQTN